MHLRLSLSIIFVLLNIVRRTTTSSWNYADEGPDVWSDMYPACGGLQQSPINILTACTTYQNFTPFNLTADYAVQHNFTLTNNGHTIASTYQNSSTDTSFPFQLTGGGLNGTFQFVNFHLHWGQNYKSGSEHQVNGVKYAGEIHFVHMNPSTQQIAVLAIFMLSDANLNTTQGKRRRRDALATTAQWQIYFNTAETLKQNGSSTSLALNLGSLITSNLTDYWRYTGSLTTPPCTEGIIWTVFKQPLIFTESQLENFRENIFAQDYRGPQLLNNRTIYRSFSTEVLPTDSDYLVCTNGRNFCGSSGKSVSDVPMHFLVYLSLFIVVFSFFH